MFKIGNCYFMSKSQNLFGLLIEMGGIRRVIRVFLGQGSFRGIRTLR